MLFEVKRVDGGEVVQVYAVQTVVGESAVHTPIPVVVFLIFNEKQARWELVEASQFYPMDFEPSEKSDKAAKTDSGILLS